MDRTHNYCTNIMIYADTTPDLANPAVFFGANLYRRSLCYARLPALVSSSLFSFAAVSHMVAQSWLALVALFKTYLMALVEVGLGKTPFSLYGCAQVVCLFPDTRASTKAAERPYFLHGWAKLGIGRIPRAIPCNRIGCSMKNENHIGGCIGGTDAGYWHAQLDLVRNTPTDHWMLCILRGLTSLSLEQRY